MAFLVRRLGYSQGACRTTVASPEQQFTCEGLYPRLVAAVCLLIAHAFGICVLALLFYAAPRETQHCASIVHG